MGNGLLPVIDATGTGQNVDVETGTVSGQPVIRERTYPMSGKLGLVGYTAADALAHQINPASIPCQGLIVWVDPAVATPVFIGTAGTVTADYGAATSGVPCKPDAGTGIPCRDVNELYAIGPSGAKITLVLSQDP